MPESLFIPGVDIQENSSDTPDLAVDIALTSRAVDNFGLKLILGFEVALQEHVHVLSNGFWACVPSTYVTS